MINAKQITEALPVGTILTGNAYKYTIEEALDQGAFGITYKASVKMEGALGVLDTGVIVTIKEFFMEEINGRENTTVTGSEKNRTFSYYKERFIKEAMSLGNMSHPNIVKVLEQFEANNTAYYVMEFIAGGNLDKKIAASGRLSEAQIVNYTRQIWEALQFMHSRHMLHLDLKPKNVMLTTDDTVKLIDFGLAKKFDDDGKPETDTRIGHGTHGYAPMEQANYSGDTVDIPTTMDIYALGATMFKMATGKCPPDAFDVFNSGLPSNELAGVSSELREVIEKAMAPKITDRYQDLSEMSFVFTKCRENTHYARNTGKKNHIKEESYRQGDTPGPVRTEGKTVRRYEQQEHKPELLNTGKNLMAYLAGGNDVGTNCCQQAIWARMPLNDSIFIICEGVQAIKENGKEPAIRDEAARIESARIAGECLYGEIASRAPKCKNIVEMIQQAVLRTNTLLFEDNRKNNSRKLISAVALLLISTECAYIFHIGKCRVYHIQNNKIKYITRDNSEANDLADKGLLSPYQAKVWGFSNLTKLALGMKSDITVKVDRVPYTKDDCFILCPQSTYSEIGELKFDRLLAENKSDITALAKKIVAEFDKGNGDGAIQDSESRAFYAVQTNVNSKSPIKEWLKYAFATSKEVRQLYALIPPLPKW